MPKRSASKVFRKQRDVAYYRLQFALRNPACSKKFLQLSTLLQNEIAPQCNSSILDKILPANADLKVRQALSDLEKKFICAAAIPKNPEAVTLINELEKDFGAFHTWAYNAFLFLEREPEKLCTQKIAESKCSLVLDAFSSLWMSGMALYEGHAGHIPATAFKLASFNQAKPPSPLSPTSPLVDLRIDLTFPKEDILAHVEFLINSFQGIHKTKPNNALRKRLDLYDTYLKAWDLRAQGKTQLQLVKIFFPKTYQDHYENSRVKVNSYIRKASLLINGGYKDIK